MHICMYSRNIIACVCTSMFVCKCYVSIGVSTMQHMWFQVFNSLFVKVAMLLRHINYT